jgi:hypothetical protein
MKRLCTAYVVAALVVWGSLAHAAPPTVTPSPGYDARLQEQHKANSTSTPTSTLVQPVTPRAPPVRRHYAKH